MNRILVSAVLVAAAAGAAQADVYTPIGSPPGGEQNIAYILGLVQTGSWTANGLNYDNGAFHAIRVADGTSADVGLGQIAGTNLNVHTGNAAGVTDQGFQDRTIRIKAEAVYSGASQTFGWRDNLGGTHDFATSPATAINNPLPTVMGTIDTSTVLGGNGSFSLYDTSANGTMFSTESDNAAADAAHGDRRDHMVTYELIGFGGARQFIVFFEDSLNGDYDFNDLAVRLTVVPLPPAAWAGLSTLAGVAGIGYVRRRRLTVG